MSEFIFRKKGVSTSMVKPLPVIPDFILAVIIDTY